MHVEEGLRSEARLLISEIFEISHAFNLILILSKELRS